MDPDSFAMSSYQFVNSLASCYPQSQLAQQQQSQQAPQHSQHPAANQTASASDYFANPTYNPNLYSPHYANQNYLATQQQQQQQQAATAAADMVDYTQLQPQRMMLGGAVPGPQQTAQTQNAQAGGHPVAAAVTNANSCKYAAGSESGTNNNLAGNNTTTAGPISSPQDLSTARELVSPKLSPNTVVNESLKGRNINNNNNNSNPTTNLSLHSPTGDSDTDSDSGGEDNEGGSGGAARGGKKGSGSGPPTVYPWMKRVHLGQSK